MEKDIFEKRAREIFAKMAQLKAIFGEDEHKAVRIFEDAPLYDEPQLSKLAALQAQIVYGESGDRPALIKKFAELRDSMRPTRPAEKIYLWDEGNMPTQTEYAENPNFRYNHDPDFKPYMFELLVPESVTPKGAVVCIAGGDHGHASIGEGYQVCKDFVDMGYQAFMLNNRTNHNPWNEFESGADAARAVRIIRANAAKYRISPDRIAIAGFSNGGLTGENCILHFSGEKTVKQHFPNYIPDKYDAFYGAPDAFICVYGPRFKDNPIDFTGVIYPPTFFAVGREDSAMDNFNYVYPILVSHGVPVEAHTFAGTPHGIAGHKFFEELKYPLFELWLPLADAFMRDVYEKRTKA